MTGATVEGKKKYSFLIYMLYCNLTFILINRVEDFNPNCSNAIFYIMT